MFMVLIIVMIVVEIIKLGPPKIFKIYM